MRMPLKHALHRICTNTGWTAVVFLSFCACGGKTPAAKDVAAKVANPVKEDALTTVTLSEQAEQRLGIETVPAESKALPGVLETGGEVMAVPGRDVRVVAPAAGTVRYPSTGVSALAGLQVRKGQEVMRLALIPPEKEFSSSQEELAVKEAEYNVASAKLKRAEQLLADGAVSEKGYQEAQVQWVAARGALHVARARQNLLTSNGPDSSGADLSVLVLESPVSGVLQKVFVAPGQTVPSSTPLFDVAGQDPVWIRVPVYVGEVREIDAAKSAEIHPMGNALPDGRTAARPVHGPPLSDPGSATADLFYRLENGTGRFRIGEKVMVSLPRRSVQPGCTIPFSSVLYDMFGGSWVYVNVSPHVYARRRVDVHHVVDRTAVVTRGLAAGDEVVVSGAAEMFGTEFGGGK